MDNPPPMEDDPSVKNNQKSPTKTTPAGNAKQPKSQNKRKNSRKGKAKPKKEKSGGASGTKKDKKRLPRAKKSHACFRCRKSKVRCEGGIPCLRCVRMGQASSCELAEQKRGSTPQMTHLGTPELGPRESNRAASIQSVNAPSLLPNVTTQTMPIGNPGFQFPTSTPQTNPMPQAQSMHMHGSGANVHNSLFQPMMPQQQQSMPSSDLRLTLPPLDLNQYFSCLLDNFNGWLRMLQKQPQPSVSSVSRFVWFCTKIMYEAKLYIRETKQNAQLPIKVSEEVSKVLARLDSVFVMSVLQPKAIHMHDLELRVQKQVFQLLPFGVAMATLQTNCTGRDHPPDTTAATWVNNRLCAMFEMHKSDLLPAFADPITLMRLIHRDSMQLYLKRFITAVVSRHTGFSCRLVWNMKRPAALLTTCSLVYNEEKPIRITFFLQALPHHSAGQVAQSSMPSQASFRMPYPNQSPNMSMDNIPPHLMQAQHQPQSMPNAAMNQMLPQHMAHGRNGMQLTQHMQAQRSPNAQPQPQQQPQQQVPRPVKKQRMEYKPDLRVMIPDSDNNADMMQAFHADDIKPPPAPSVKREQQKLRQKEDCAESQHVEDPLNDLDLKHSILAKEPVYVFPDDIDAVSNTSPQNTPDTDATPAAFDLPFGEAMLPDPWSDWK